MAKKPVTTNKLNRFWQKGVLPRLEKKVNVSDIVNDFTTTVANRVADARALKTLMDKFNELNRNYQRQNKKLWEGTAINSGLIACDTTGYTVFDMYCTDGVMLRGIKLYDTTNKRYYAVLGASGGAYNGSTYIPAVWQGLIDIYDDHFYLHGITMYTIPDGQSYTGHHLSAIYGIW